MIYNPDPIAETFRSPDDEVPKEGTYSNLYLLRKHLQELYGPEDNTTFMEWKSTLLATLGIMAGFNLLSKLWCGKLMRDDKTSFKKFMQEAMGINHNDAEVLYKLRCALVHSYGLMDKRGGQIYDFVLDNELFNLELIKPIPTENHEGLQAKRYRISLLQLKKYFVMVVNKFRQLLEERTNPRLMSNFLEIYRETGVILLTQ